MSIFYRLAISLFALSFFITPVAGATTVDELLAQIEALKKQISALEQQAAALGRTTATSWCHTFNTNLKVGLSSGDEVAFLHIALEKDGFTVTNEEKVARRFGESTEAAVFGFQQKYKDEILSPIGLNAPTGYVAEFTRAKLNKLFGCVGAVATSSSAPTVTLYTSGSVINNNTSATLSWSSSGATSCTASNGWSGAKGLFGSESTGNLTVSKTYTITCTGAGGVTTQSVTVSVAGDTTTSTITVLSPNGGEAWQAGSTQIIRWASSGNIPLVDITTISSTNIYIANSIPNNGSYTWTIPASFSLGQYKIRVAEPTGGVGKAIDDSDAPFTVASTTTTGTATTSSVVKVISPNGGETWVIGQKNIITFLVWEGNEDVTVALYKNGARLETIGSDTNVSKGIRTSYGWDIPSSATDLIGTGYKVRVTAGKEYDESDKTFNIATTSPTVTSTQDSTTATTTVTLSSISPAAGPTGTNITLYGCGPSSASGYTLLYTGAGVTGSATIPVVDTGGSCGYMIVSVPIGLPAGMYTLKVKNNQTGAVSTNSMTFVVTTGTTPPPVGNTPLPSAPIVTLTGITPSSGPVGTTVYLSGCGPGSALGYNLIYSGTMSGSARIGVVSLGTSGCGYMTFAVPTSFPAGTYTLSVKNNSTGQTSANTVTFTVTTAQTSTSPVTLTSVTPASGPVGTNVTLYGCDGGSNNGYTLLYGGPRNGANVLSVTSTGSGCGYMSFTVPSDFPAGTYTLTVKNNQTGVVSTNSMTFVVTVTTTTTNPTIISFSPSSGAQGSSVAIYGSGFSPTGNTVSYRDGGGNHTIASGLPSYNNGTLIYLTVPNPSNNGAYSVKVVNSAGISSNELTFTVINNVAIVSSESQLASVLTAMQQLLQSMLKTLSR